MRERKGGRKGRKRWKVDGKRMQSNGGGRGGDWTTEKKRIKERKGVRKDIEWKEKGSKKECRIKIE